MKKNQITYCNPKDQAIEDLQFEEMEEADRRWPREGDCSQVRKRSREIWEEKTLSCNIGRTKRTNL